ncbi:Clr5 domain-containing protein [Nemania abortiva]|nr:Clr5 domain-containing protein [Nemania abortiva]
MQSSGGARLESDGAAEHGRVRYAKPSEWAAQKDIIKALYLDENKTLDEVRRIMADEHQFHATPSMYKKRIRAWHFSKKLEEGDVLEVLEHKIEKREAGETSHNLVIRGRVVRNQRLRRFLERRPDVLVRLQVHPDSLASISSHSSSYGVPTEVPRVRSLSPESRNLELTLSAVRDYIQVRAIGANAWTWAPGGYTAPARGNTPPTQAIIESKNSRIDMLRAVDEFYLLQDSIDNKGAPKDIFQHLNSTLNLLNGAMRAELPDLIFQMIEILQHPWSNHPELARIFRKHVADLGAVHLGKEHPLSILWLNMLGGDENNSVRLTHDVLEMVLQELLMTMGPQDPLTCVALDYVLRFIIQSQDAITSWKRFNRWLTAYPKWDDLPKWQEEVEFRLKRSNDLIAVPEQEHHASSSRLLTSPAMEYQRGAPSRDVHSRYLLAYMAGRIAIRNGDADRAEGWFLRAKTAAKQAPAFHTVDYFLKTFTNLHVLYTATDQMDKLAQLHKELVVFKAELPAGAKWLSRLLPQSCPDCV